MTGRRLVGTLVLVLALTAPLLANEGLRLVPQTTALLARLDCTRSAKKPLMADLLGAIRAGLGTDHHRDLLAVLRAAGLEPERDLHTITLFAIDPDPKTHPEIGIIVTGSFDPARIIKTVTAQRQLNGTIRPQTIEGQPALRFVAANQSMPLVFLGKQAAVFGSEAAVAAATAVHLRRQGGIGGNAAFRDLIGKAAPKADAWLVVPRPAGAAATSTIGQVLGGLWISANIDQALRLTVCGEAERAEDATSLAAAARGALVAGLPVLAALTGAGAGAPVDPKIEVSGRRVQMVATISSDDLRRFGQQFLAAPAANR